MAITSIFEAAGSAARLWAGRKGPHWRVTPEPAERSTWGKKNMLYIEYIQIINNTQLHMYIYIYDYICIYMYICIYIYIYRKLENTHIYIYTLCPNKHADKCVYLIFQILTRTSMGKVSMLSLFIMINHDKFLMCFIGNPKKKYPVWSPGWTRNLQLLYIYIHTHMGVSTNGRSSKWMVYNVKSDEHGWSRGTPIFRKPFIYIYIYI